MDPIFPVSNPLTQVWDNFASLIGVMNPAGNDAAAGIAGDYVISPADIAASLESGSTLQNLGDAATATGAAISDALPSEKGLITTGVGIATILILVLLVIGKVEAL